MGIKWFFFFYTCCLVVFPKLSYNFYYVVYNIAIPNWTGMSSVKFTILLDLFRSWSFILYLGELPTLMFWQIVLKISLLLKKCIQIINVIEKSHFMVISEAVIWKRAIRCVPQLYHTIVSEPISWKMMMIKI